MFPGWSVVKWLQAQTPEPDCPGLNSVVLGKLFNFPVSSSPYLWKGDNNGAYFREFLGGLDEFVICKALGDQCLGFRKEVLHSVLSSSPQEEVGEHHCLLADGAMMGEAHLTALGKMLVTGCTQTMSYYVYERSLPF